jgi:hypothetical protein
MTLKNFYSLGVIREDDVVKTQPVYKDADIEGKRLLETGLNGQKKKPSTGKREDHPKVYWKMTKPKSAPQINNDYSKVGIEIEPTEVQKSIIKPVKPHVIKGPRTLGRKPFNKNEDLDFNEVVKIVAKRRPDLDFAMSERLVEVLWPAMVGNAIAAMSSMGKRGGNVSTADLERLAKLIRGDR